MDLDVDVQEMASRRASGAAQLKSLVSLLKKSAEPKTKQWFERYMKHVIPFHGLKMATIRSCVHNWVKAESIDQLSGADGLSLCVSLMQQSMAEEKMAGILLLHEVVIPSEDVGWRAIVDELGKLYEDGYIYDWNTSDWLSVKVLHGLIERNGQRCAESLAEWAQSANLWRRRSAGVAFVYLAKGGDEKNFAGFVDLVLGICEKTVSCQERFAQTGTGWVLRELAVANRDCVVDFVEEHAAEFTSEGVDYTTEKMPEALKKRLKALVRRHSGKDTVGARKKVKRS